jgi:tetratricopeptide (TPR) repeat protein
MTGDRQKLLPAALLIIAVVAAYANHFQNGFHFDDSHTIVNNVFVKNVRNIPLFFTDGTTFSSLPANQSYRPLVSTTLAVDYWLGNGNVFFFHLSTFLLFLFQGFLMYFFYLRIFRISYPHAWIETAALFAAAWYLLHPANAETINYIIARSDSLSTFFIVLAFVLFIYSPFCRRWHLYLVPVALGALAKPIAGIFGPLLFVYILFFEEKSSLVDLIKKKGVPALRSSLKKAMPALLASLSLMLFIKKMDPPTWAPGGHSEFQYVITQPYVMLHYFTTFFLPLGLTADTDLHAFTSMADYRFFLGTVFLILLLMAVFFFSKAERTRPIAFGLFWFFITLLPTSLIPLAEVMNDHRLFLPYVGLTLSTCWSLLLLLSSAKKTAVSDKVFLRVTIVTILVLLAAYAYGTAQRNAVWKTEETLWHDVVKKSPENGRGLMNYGLCLMAKADYNDAEKYFKNALKFTPSYATLHINLGIVKAATGRTGEAETYFRKAIALNPDYPDAYFYYARFLKDQGRFDAAIANALTTLKLAPGHLYARYLLMDIYSIRHKYRALAILANETLRIVPNDRKALQSLAEANSGGVSNSISNTSAPKSGTVESVLH